MKTVAVSGGFDPIHVGHVRMFLEARKLGDRLVVFLNTDEWLDRKKGFHFMNWAERAEIIRALRPVDYVIKVCDEDDTVIRTLTEYRPSVFVNAGDRPLNSIPEASICNELGISLAYLSVGYLGHSSDLVREACHKLRMK